MKIQFLFPYPLGESPSQRFRFEQYFMILHQAGFITSCQSFWDERSWKILYTRGHLLLKIIGTIMGVLRRMKILFQLSRVDFIFIHRECIPLGPPFLEWLIAKVLQKKIIYDFDDAIWLPDSSSENRIISYLKFRSKVMSICKWSYKISCGNDYLADFARQFNSNVTINPSTIDTEVLHNPNHHSVTEAKDTINIGWTGSHSTLKYLDFLWPVLFQLENKYPGKIQFVLIANKRPETVLKSLCFIPWSKETEISDLLKLDIGVMPLPDDDWAQGKCGFKALQYLSLNIPAVVSPMGVNSKIVTSGVEGYLCMDEKEWLARLEILILDPSLRKQMGINGRKKIIEHYSVSSNSVNFLSLFE